jgi:hypothetical protein
MTMLFGKNIIGTFTFLILLGFLACNAPVAPPPLVQSKELDSLIESQTFLILGAPSNLSILATDSTVIGLGWKINSNKYTATVIEKSVNGSTFIKLIALRKLIPDYLDYQVSTSNSYQYRTYAIIDSTGRSIYSNAITVRYNLQKTIWVQQ